jgi:hypothetical protein
MTAVQGDRGMVRAVLAQLGQQGVIDREQCAPTRTELDGSINRSRKRHHGQVVRRFDRSDRMSRRKGCDRFRPIAADRQPPSRRPSRLR